MTGKSFYYLVDIRCCTSKCPRSPLQQPHNRPARITHLANNSGSFPVITIGSQPLCLDRSDREGCRFQPGRHVEIQSHTVQRHQHRQLINEHQSRSNKYQKPHKPSGVIGLSHPRAQRIPDHQPCRRHLRGADPPRIKRRQGADGRTAGRPR